MGEEQEEAKERRKEDELGGVSSVVQDEKVWGSPEQRLAITVDLHWAGTARLQDALPPARSLAASGWGRK